MNRFFKWLILLLVITLLGVIVFFYFQQKLNPSQSYSNADTSQNDSLIAVYTNFDNCPPEGDAVSEKAHDLNKYKNRCVFPKPADFTEGISLDVILQPGNDKDRWQLGKAARISGYVYEVKSGGVETCNCKERNEVDKDTHIELVADPMQTGKLQRMIIEVTPRMRDIMAHRGEDWSTQILRDKFLGRWIEAEGWLLFDDEHEMNAENTNPGNPRNWRATAWELHPITSIKVITRQVN